MSVASQQIGAAGAAFAALCAAALLSGCGTGGDQSTATASSEGHLAQARAGDGVTFSKPDPDAGHESAATRAERRAAGRAAPFVAQGADNSIPTFGAEAGAAERQAAAANLRAYFAARATREWARACALLSATTREGFEKLATAKGGARCARLLPVLAPLRAGTPADPLRGGTLVSFRVKGDSGFALFYGPPGHQQYIVPMQREAGGWRPSQASAIAYPPGGTP